MHDYNIASGATGKFRHWWKSARTSCGRKISPYDNSWMSAENALKQVDCPLCRKHIIANERPIAIPYKSPGGGTTIEVTKRPMRLHLWVGQGDPGKDPMLSQGVTTQIEDESHDWSWRAGTLRYHGVGCMSGGGEGWLILQFIEVPNKTCSNCYEESPPKADFCTHCGRAL